MFGCCRCIQCRWRQHRPVDLQQWHQSGLDSPVNLWRFIKRQGFVPKPRVENLATAFTLWLGFNHHHKISAIDLDHLCQENALTLPVDLCYSYQTSSVID